jgi:threonine dehydratase
MLPTLDDIESAARIVYSVMPATPQYCWPLLQVTDDEVAAASRAIFECTHNVATGAGAAPVAAALQDKPRIAGRRIAVVLSGGNVDRTVFADVLGLPAPLSPGRPHSP